MMLMISLKTREYKPILHKDRMLRVMSFKMTPKSVILKDCLALPLASKMLDKGASK